MLNQIAVVVSAFLGWLVGRAIGYVIGFRGGCSLLERPGRTQKLRLKTIDEGEKLFERFNGLGALAAPGSVSGINKVPVPTFVLASVVAALGWTLSTGLVASISPLYPVFFFCSRKMSE